MLSTTKNKMKHVETKSVSSKVSDNFQHNSRLGIFTEVTKIINVPGIKVFSISLRPGYWKYQLVISTENKN